MATIMKQIKFTAPCAVSRSEDLSILGCEQLKSIITNDEDLGKEIFEGDNDDNMVVQCFQICSYQNLEP